MKRMKRFTYTLMCAAMTAALTAPLASCSNDFDAVESVDEFVGEEIKVCSFPAFTTDGSTRAVDEKSSWDSNDVIYVQVNGEGEWYALSYSDGKWSAPEGFSMKKTDTYKAVYAPNYAPDSETNVLTLKSDAVASTAEYLTCEGTRPIEINFTRNYSRLRLSAAANTTISVSFGEGFTANDGSDVKSFSLTTNGDGDAYVYGKWGEKTKLTILSAISGSDASSATFYGNIKVESIAKASVDGKAYKSTVSTSDDVWIIHNLDVATTAKTDWSDFISDTYTKIKVIGTWSDDKAPTFIGFDSSYTTTVCEKITKIDISGVSGLKNIPDKFCYYCSNMNTIFLPDGIEVIGKRAFDTCDKLSLEKLPDTVTDIGYGAFMYCSKLGLKVLPSSLKTLGSYAFWDVIFGSESLVLPDGLNEITAGCFCNTGLKNITIPSGVTKIGAAAFGGLKNIVLTCKANRAPSINTEEGYDSYEGPTFDDAGNDNQSTLYIPTGSTESYKEAKWGDYFTNIIETDFSE
jgi:hypothetical protein